MIWPTFEVLVHTPHGEFPLDFLNSVCQNPNSLQKVLFAVPGANRVIHFFIKLENSNSSGSIWMQKCVFLLFLIFPFYAQVHWSSLSFSPHNQLCSTLFHRNGSQRNKVRFGRSGCGPVLVSTLLDTHTWKIWFKQLAHKVYMFAVKIQICF